MRALGFWLADRLADLLRVPRLVRPEPALHPDPIPPGLYELPPGTILTGYEPPSYYLPFRVGSAERVDLRYAAA